LKTTLSTVCVEDAAPHGYQVVKQLVQQHNSMHVGYRSRLKVAESDQLSTGLVGDLLCRWLRASQRATGHAQQARPASGGHRQAAPVSAETEEADSEA